MTESRVRRMRDMESFTHEEVARVVPFVQKNVPQSSKSFGLVNGLTLTVASYLSLIDAVEKLKEELPWLVSAAVQKEMKRAFNTGSPLSVDNSANNLADAVSAAITTLLEKA